jgi:hypothetical protein
MTCPRCDSDTVRKIAASAVAGAWDVLQCARCLYMWRTSEPARRTTREAYPEPFRMTRDDIDHTHEVPTVPPLRDH